MMQLLLQLLLTLRVALPPSITSKHHHKVKLHQTKKFTSSDPTCSLIEASFPFPLHQMTGNSILYLELSNVILVHLVMNVLE